jgi:hypothetical protein
MIDELVNDAESELDNKGSDDPYSTYHLATFTGASYMIRCPTVISNNKRIGVLKRTYVHHGSTRVIPQISIPRMYYPR